MRVCVYNFFLISLELKYSFIYLFIYIFIHFLLSVSQLLVFNMKITFH